MSAWRYTGIEGINTQDRAVQESMGYIADRPLERLGTTDRAIIAARRLLLQALEAVERGEEPPSVAPTYYRRRAIERVLPAAAYWYEEMKAVLYQLPPTTDAVDAVPLDEKNVSPAGVRMTGGLNWPWKPEWRLSW